MANIARQAKLDSISDNWIELSKHGTGVGIQVDRIRPVGASVGGNGNPFNWLHKILDKNKWAVLKNQPFTVSNIKDLDPPFRVPDMEMFERRIDAEKASILFELEYIKTSGKFDDQPKELVFEYIGYLKGKLENLEEEHPEWVI
jgi:hypothetical protein